MFRKYTNNRELALQWLEAAETLGCEVELRTTRMSGAAFGEAAKVDRHERPGLWNEGVILKVWILEITACDEESGEFRPDL